MSDESNKIWDLCTGCYKKMKPSAEEWNFRHCERCNNIVRTLVCIISVGILALIYFHTTFRGFSSLKYNLATLGYLFDLIGGICLATGFGDIITMAAASFGGGGSTFKKYTWKNFVRRNLGLTFIAVGFVLMGIANLMP